MKRLSRVALAAAAVALIAPVSGCAALLSAQQTAQYQYNGGDGASADFGDVAIRGLLLVGNGEGDANLFYAIVNNSDQEAQVEFEVGDATVSETVPAGGELLQNPDNPFLDQEPIVVSGYEGEPGALQDVEVTVNGESQTVRTQIVSDALPEYATLVPTAPAEGGEDPTDPAATETAGAEEPTAS
ncbi:hypothetical protein GCM10022261_06700 [Brevibacterium daeguense]|uniref:DNA modification methylase n=1 Tax=Brevibacterium daeguense TaxID=909936 RepID=A0ABP8EGP3_9MICO|nr:hypothetical protein [Brevibacterium daeguense]